LDQAARNGQVEIVRLLIDHGANLHTADTNGWTPLHVSSRSGHLEVVKLLLRRGMDIDVLDKAIKTAAELASENNKAEVANFLAEYKADANVRNNLRSKILDKTLSADEDGKDKERSSLHTASYEGKVKVVKLLLDQGADINSREWNKTPLHVAAREGHLTVNITRFLH
jgi:ankyrin repeat protein